MNNFVIGIDGGGSRARARLANARGETLGAGDAGACNPQAVGFENAQREIRAAIQRAFDAAKVAKQLVAAACLGIGGVERADERALMREWARAEIAPRVEILNDAEIVLAAGTPENWGIALIAGTGSIAWGKTRAGKFARAGGWGYLIGDEGSAFDLSREALRAVTRATDGRGEPTRLAEKILQFWKLQTPPELIPRVYRSGMKPADLAQIAPLVMDAADEGDPVARELIARAGQELAAAIIAVARALNIAEKEIPLALAGGLLLNAGSLRAQLLAALNASAFIFAPVEWVNEPVKGAVKIALDLSLRGAS